MKKLLLILPMTFLLCFVYGCQGEDVAGEAEQQNVEEIVQQWLDMFASKDLSMIDDLYLVEAIFEDVPDATVYHGREKIKKTMAEDFIYAPDMVIESKEKFLGKNWAIVEWIWNGTQTGDIEGVIKATGKKFTIKGVSVLEFQDGKIKRHSDYYNAGRLLYQLGVKFVFPSGRIIQMEENK